MDGLQNSRLQVAAARADFLQSGQQAESVRGLIAASWERSSAAGVDAFRTSARYHSDLDTSGRLVRSARSVIDRLAEETSELALSIALTDSMARLLLRFDTHATIGRLLDGVEFAPGFEYTEDAMGTNGVGTAFESRQPVVVSGPEHFSERLQAFSCTGAPIRDPITGRVEGVLDLTCLVQHSTPVIRSLVRTATQEIERRLILDRDDEQHAVYERYALAAARAGVAVGGVGSSMLLSNRRLQEDFDADEQEAIREHARFLAERRETGDDVVTLASGRRVAVRGHRVQVGSRTAGVVFEAREVAHRPPAPRETTTIGLASGSRRPSADGRAIEAPPAGFTPAWRRAVDQTTAALRGRVPLLVMGERSTGKASLVTDCFRAEHPDGLLLDVDATAFSSDAATRREVRLALQSAPRDVLVLFRRIDRVPEAGMATIDRMLVASDDPEHPFGVAATMVRPESAERHPVSDFRECVVVPALRHRRQDLPIIVDRLLRELGSNRRAADEFLRAISRHDWPGNLADLRTVLQEAADRRPVGPLVAADLPERLFAGSRRTLGALESAERDTIVAALRNHGGNRVRAAEELGISRATLYRKLQQYAISI